VTLSGVPVRLRWSWALVPLLAAWAVSAGGLRYLALLQATILLAGPAAHAIWTGGWLLVSLVGGGTDPAPHSVYSLLRGGALLAGLWALGNLRPIGGSDGARLLALALAADPDGRWRVWFVSGTGVFLLLAGGFLVAESGLWFVGGMFVLAGLLAQVGAWSLK
jgi:hypothetical protein